MSDMNDKTNNEKPVLWQSSDTEGYQVFVSSLTTEYDPATNTVKLTFHEESDTAQGVTIVRVKPSYLPGMVAHLRSVAESLERLKLEGKTARAAEIESISDTGTVTLKRPLQPGESILAVEINPEGGDE